MPARNLIILEVYEENIYTSREVFEELTPHLDPDHQELLPPKIITVQQIAGTRFFVAPASVFYQPEVVI